jgi:hypothetical protein
MKDGMTVTAKNTTYIRHSCCVPGIDHDMQGNLLPHSLNDAPLLVLYISPSAFCLLLSRSDLSRKGPSEPGPLVISTG